MKKDSKLLNFKDSPNKMQMDHITICKEGKGVDDNYIEVANRKKNGSLEIIMTQNLEDY